MMTATEAYKLAKENRRENEEKTLQLIETKYLPLIEEKIIAACDKGKHSVIVSINNIPTYIENACFLQMICDYLIILGYQARYYTFGFSIYEVTISWEEVKNEPEPM